MTAFVRETTKELIDTNNRDSELINNDNEIGNTIANFRQMLRHLVIQSMSDTITSPNRQEYPEEFDEDVHTAVQIIGARSENEITLVKIEGYITGARLELAELLGSSLYGANVKLTVISATRFSENGQLGTVGLTQSALDPAVATKNSPPVLLMPI